MKCPHCGMNIRDNIEVCGYCGGNIVQESEKSPSGTGRPESSGGGSGQKGAGTKASGSLQQESESDDEEEGGISVYLQSGEQVLIGSLNIAVKKFFFHAYLTNQRIFLIDTQEKKVKVTAKDIPRESIVGSSLEYSENSDPVLVLSLRSADDEIKTMKLIFIQNGLDRSDEIDEWVTLLKEQAPSKKIPAQVEKELPLEKEELPPVPKEKPVQKQELQPKRKPGKELEKQPPVKRHVVFHKMQEEPVSDVEESRPQRRSTVREVPEPVKKPETEHEPSYYEISPARRGDTQPLRKREVQSAMKVAMKNAMQPLKPSSLQAVKRPVTEHLSAPVKEPEPEGTEGIGREAGTREPAVAEERNELPPFCQNCGKKIPPAANFCPGCGTKLAASKAGSPEWIPPPEKKTAHHETPAREKKAPSRVEGSDEEEKEEQVPTKHPAKKGPKGSEMTILHKFLRR